MLWNRRLKALRHKIEHRCNLFPRHIELFHYFFDAQILEIFDAVATGKRVSRNTQAPLTLPGTLSTAGHWDQSRVGMFLTSLSS